MSNEVRKLTRMERSDIRGNGRYVWGDGTRTRFTGRLTGLNGERLYIFGTSFYKNDFSYRILNSNELQEEVFKKRRIKRV